MRLLALGIALLAAACNSAEPTADADTNAGGRLIDHERWKPVTDSTDPFRGEAPAKIDCAPGSTKIEGTTPDTKLYEVDTTNCNYLTASQPALLPVHSGDTLEIAAWHLDLVAPTKTQGLIGVALGKQRIWTQRVDIPAPAKIFTPKIVSSADYPAETPVYFHVQNHGTNVWRLLEIKVTRKKE